MAMSAAVAGGGVQSTPNVTPMIDVMLVLLIIFMVVDAGAAGGLQRRPAAGAEPEGPSRGRRDRSGARHRQGWQLLPEQEADRQDGRRGRRSSASTTTRRATTRSCTSRPTRTSTTPRCSTPSTSRRKNGVRVVGHDQRPEAGHGVDGRRRHARQQRRRARSRREAIMAMSAGGGGGLDERDQRHADDRRAARAADHLHGGAAVDAEGDRHPASRSESDGRAGEREVRIRSCSR